MSELGPGTLETRQVLLEFSGTRDDGAQVTVRVVVETETADATE